MTSTAISQQQRPTEYREPQGSHKPSLFHGLPYLAALIVPLALALLAA